ncbi:MAG TPA: hypothetical protein VG165_03120 [Solirubrobacteraceae bacterium]|jgi:hypothetical protein|nr:hypothetical protein [Solirubrobacteraceae bacterium]
MPVTNSNKGKPLPYVERGGSGLPPKPNPDRPVGTLANNAGMAENVGRLSAEELAARKVDFEFKFDTPAPVHVTQTDPDHTKTKQSPSSVAFGALMGAVKVGVTATGGVRGRFRRK